jgi:transposase
MNRDALERLSKDDLIALVLAQAEQIAALTARVGELIARVAELEAKLGEPPKTPDNSSLPPSRGHKANRPSRRKGRRPRGGVARLLHPDPDRIVEAIAEACPHCAAPLAEGEQALSAVYDRIELPPIRPLVTRVRLYGGRCRRCGKRFTAPTPAGLEPGSPFGASIAALAVYLRFGHAIGFERLSALFADVFGLDISEGALANLFTRVKPCFDDQAEAIARSVVDSAIVCSDETSARVEGRNWWEWVFLGGGAALHLIRPSRGKQVPEAVFAGRRPAVWVSDLFGAQQGHAAAWQVCLAHQLRDLQYAIDAGDEVFAPAMKRIVLRAIAIGKRRDRLRDSTLQSYRADLDRRVDAAMRLRPTNRHGLRLRKHFAKSLPPRRRGSATTCSCSSPSARCPTPTTPQSAHSGPASCSAR